MCDHSKSEISLPKANSIIYKEECTLCFENQDSEDGIDVCLSCYNGSCVSSHTGLHFTKTKHPLYLNIKRKKQNDETKRPEKITKLSIQEDKTTYEFKTSIKCIPCGGIEIDKSSSNLTLVIPAILAAISAKNQSDLKAWEEESLKSCYHTNELVQTDSTVLSKCIWI